ncbi:TPA: hypothetical protein ACGO8V_001620 [Streptococcus suis]
MDKVQIDLFVVRIIGYDPKKRRYSYSEKEFPSEYEAIQFMKKLRELYISLHQLQHIVFETIKKGDFQMEIVFSIFRISSS